MQRETIIEQAEKQKNELNKMRKVYCEMYCDIEMQRDCPLEYVFNDLIRGIDKIIVEAEKLEIYLPKVPLNAFKNNKNLK